MRPSMAELRQRLSRILWLVRHKLFFREQRRYRETLRAASIGMTRIRSLPRLLNLIVRVLVSNVRISHATIFLKDKDEPTFVAAASQGKLKKPVGSLRVEESTKLVALLAKRREPVVYQELKAELERMPKNAETKPAMAVLKYALWEMERLQTLVCVPSFIHGRLQGFLMLGEKISGDVYDQDDLSVFSALASQAAMAIENAQAYEELRDTRDQLLHSERLSTIGKFAADMAHEIKNPLSTIHGFLEMLPEKYNDPDFRDRYSKLALAEAERIDDLVRQLMVYARPKAPDFKPIEMAQAIDSVLALLENDLHQNRIEVRKGYSQNGLTVEADRNQMKQVFLNLFTNATEAMVGNGEKPGLLDIVAFPEGDQLIVKVRDAGAGIPESEQRLIFAPFYTTKEKGSGLGLAIVQNILRAHNASIHVESQNGVGTTFTIVIPKRQADRPAPVEMATVSSAPEQPMRAIKRAPSAASILIVDPEKETLESIRLIFEKRGITCWVATTAVEALELLKVHQPDFVLSEIILKERDISAVSPEGFDILREAKRIFPERPVYLITACDLPEYRQKARELGADGYLVKPIESDKLLSILPGPVR